MEMDPEFDYLRESHPLLYNSISFQRWNELINHLNSRDFSSRMKREFNVWYGKCFDGDAGASQLRNALLLRLATTGPEDVGPDQECLALILAVWMPHAKRVAPGGKTRDTDGLPVLLALTENALAAMWLVKDGVLGTYTLRSQITAAYGVKVGPLGERSPAVQTVESDGEGGSDVDTYVLPYEMPPRIQREMQAALIGGLGFHA